jgi:hypothetical protein
MTPTIFWQNTLPLMVALVVTVFGASLAGWASNKNPGQRVDDLRDSVNHRLDEVARRLDRIEQKNLELRFAPHYSGGTDRSISPLA